MDPDHQGAAQGRQHRDALHGALQARTAQPVHPGCAAAEPEPSQHGRRGLHPALHPGARGSQPDHRVPGPRPSAAQGRRGMPAGRGLGHRQPQGCPRGVGRRHPGDAADEARRRRRRDRRRLSRLAGNRRLAIPAYHNRPSAPTNLTLHQALDINVPIGCGDVAVWPGDVVVGDGEGVVVIPAAIADEVAAEAVEMTAFEDFVIEKVQEGRSILGLYPPTDEASRKDFEAWRKAKGRWPVQHAGHVSRPRRKPRAIGEPRRGMVARDRVHSQRLCACDQRAVERPPPAVEPTAARPRAPGLGLARPASDLPQADLVHRVVGALVITRLARSRVGRMLSRRLRRLMSRQILRGRLASPPTASGPCSGGSRSPGCGTPSAAATGSA